VDALAPKAEEGRGYLRKGPGSWQRTVIRTSPNGETRPDLFLVTRTRIHRVREGTEGTETSQYLEEEKVIPLVVASEKGRAQTRPVHKASAVAGRGLWGLTRGPDGPRGS
jgi:hypothetical protein